MQKFIAVIAVASLIGACGNEYDLGDDLPQWPESSAPSVEDITQTDRVLQVTTPEVDILWTIDNSCSMQDEQDALTLNFPIFIDYFLGSGLDFHIGVVSTDLDNNSHSGKLRESAGLRYLDVDTPNPTQIFASMAGMGVTGSGIERGLGATYLALEILADGYNSGFYRPNAAVHTVLISDEEDQTSSGLITTNEFIDWYDGLKDDAGDRSFSSIVTMSGSQRGTEYLAVTGEIGGIVWDITNDDWGTVLDQLGVQASGLKREYFLTALPVPGTIDVEVHDKGNVFKFNEASDWTYDDARNSITFLEYVPDALSEVIIDYTLLAAAQGDEDILDE